MDPIEQADMVRKARTVMRTECLAQFEYMKGNKMVEPVPPIIVARAMETIVRHSHRVPGFEHPDESIEDNPIPDSELRPIQDELMARNYEELYYSLTPKEQRRYRPWFQERVADKTLAE